MLYITAESDVHVICQWLDMCNMHGYLGTCMSSIPKCKRNHFYTFHYLKCTQIL